MSEQLLDEPEPSTAPETPAAKAAAVKQPKGWALVRAIVVDGLVTLGLCWAAYSGKISWELALGFTSTALLAQAKPNGSTIETAVKAIASAMPRRRG